MQAHPPILRNLIAALLSLMTLSVIACSSGTSDTQRPNQDRLLAGTWTLDARMVDGKERPAVRRQMRLSLDADGTFGSEYRGDETQRWVSAGQGAFSYDPPYLTFYWNSGQVRTVLVVERESGRLRVHHGRNMVPLNNQDPDELYVLTNPKKQDQPG